MYEAAGKLKWIGDTQSFASGFTKREFVITTAVDKYPQDLKFEVVKDKCPLLDPFALGQDVQVSFDIRGNEYNGKYFVNLACWKIQSAGTSTTPSHSSNTPVGRQNNSTPQSEPSISELRSDDDFDDESPF